MKLLSLKIAHIICLALNIISYNLHAQQVVKTTMVEHFTNTKCSICKAKNPGFHGNLNNHPQVLHLSIHPSSPYSSCILSQQNMAANDARTNYYGIYGGTPRLVISGNVIPSNANYADTALFTPFLNQLSPFSLTISNLYSSTDTLTYTITITKKDVSNLSTVILFSGVAEDTVFVNGGNGEFEHYNVMRSATQEFIMLPIAVNDSIIITRSVYVKSFWDKMRMFSHAMIQDMGSKLLIQAGQSPLAAQTLGIESENSSNNDLHIFPVPTSNILYVSNQKEFEFAIYDLTFNQIIKGHASNEAIDVRHLNAGIYLIKITKNNLSYYTKFIKQNN